MAYKRKLCDPGECGRMDYESRIGKLEVALKTAELTYAALERNRTYLVEALQAKGFPASWLGAEIAKAHKIRVVLAETKGK